MSELPQTERMAAIRIIDANYNRASEGLRVAEEYARFVLDDASLTEEIKVLRHRLTTAVFESIERKERAAARNVAGDVGCSISTDTEYQRTNLKDVLAASLQRAQQALRCIEEYSKPIDIRLARAAESIRYQAYTVDARLLRGSASRELLRKAHLYVLIDGRETEEDFAAKLSEITSRDVGIVQLRDKTLSDSELLGRARWLRRLIVGTMTLFIMNDRPDLAALSHADGVHVGQDEIPVAEVRKIVGPDMLIGVSTHTIEQARQAVRDGADYIGCGPTFPSSTKSFDHFPGLDFLRQVAAEISLPVFAIGGVGFGNVEQVLATGIQRVAVSGAVVNAKDPTAAIAELQAKLRYAAPSH